MSTNNSKTNPTQEVIDRCKEILCDEIINAKAATRAAATKNGSKNRVKLYKECCVNKADSAKDTFQSLRLCVTLPGSQNADLIKGQIKEVISKQDELGKVLQATVKEVKSMKTKMEEAMDEACKLDRCLEEEERCNPDLYKALCLLQVEDKTFKEAISEIGIHTKDCYAKVKTAFDAGVEIVGIETFVNVEGLSSTSDELIKCMKEFKDDIDANIKLSGEEWTKAMEELSAVLIDKVTCKYESCKPVIDLDTSCKTRDFICEKNENCDCYGENELDGICEKLSKGNGSTGPEENCECEEEGTPSTNPSPNPVEKSWDVI